MYKVGIIGDRDSVLGFLALGFSVHETNSAYEAGQILETLAKSDEYAVIFITEDIALKLGSVIEKFSDKPLPAITVVPGSTGGVGYGKENLRNAVIRAVGSDIIFGDKK